MGLKEVLRLKSFDSKELDIRATKTPKGDPPYLHLVHENLYQIRELEAPGGQGGSAAQVDLEAQGGSASAPAARVLNAAPIQAIVTVDDAGGRKISSAGTKGFGSKIVIEDEGIHLSVADTETRASGEKGGDGRNEDEDDEGDEGEHPQVSLKRKRAAPIKADPKPKQLKRKKTEFKTITLDDDDQVTEFSTAGGVLANLDAHLHGGRTPRGHLLKSPLSPLSFGGGGVKVVADVRTSDPKKTEPSPSGKFTTGVASNVSRPSPSPVDGGDSASSSPLWYDTEVVFLSRELGSGGIEDMNSAHALGKYVPEWSLVNKDRIVDALTAKMSLFHLGTPAEHSHYRKMSGPELGNALMLNQAQSNSLVVETYKRWVESESSCHKLKREIANLKSESDVRSKTKQELVSLRSQVERLKGKVSEAKEINKSSQASAAAANEARDKALQDLEVFKERFADLEKKQAGSEESMRRK
ncbi:hypothetical protein HanRHA438_Chr14g0674651 [Helianthus annuus]|uniref:Uncharacterized protein n=1 Tax=Helianthus annuus TaxID=4232 RepID=A0A9K3ECT4_HELAN|nr:hypothetical protein HanXRQr2_Chr14g0663511 [Helianthus annuus]KAJ0465672.1 hypothetical protein HanHA300_Chr14g0540761 [Helianthus annuus]KAJ0470546.1 hypothetical protein HanIR_Chr14g0719931 [Helianthus annuus]KAJ0487264.1 hypothetical protein HanHA89_Chr14g0588521 [Helianthus annuus]KAJ0661374.1 hypothetical protein HanOQP8_Chr14g0547861 [Helianthus annuus]